jgi:hypothetical protein
LGNNFLLSEFAQEVNGLQDMKIKLTVFWLFIAATMTANTLLYLIVPGVIDEIRTGQIVGMHAGADLILGMGIAYYWIPLVMAVLSVSLKDKLNRLANFILGVFYAFFVLFELTMNVTTVAYPYVILLDLSVFAVAASIAWHAWKWKW